MDLHIEKNIPVPMRDGVTLATDVIRPAENGPHPTLVQRLPYNKEPYWLRDSSVDTPRLAQQGYVIVVQDTRGTGQSGGDYRPFVDDRSDGFDTLKWVREQPWCNGDLGMIGISYYAGTQWLAAIEQPPGLKAIAPNSFHYDPYKGWLYRGGAFSIGCAVRWSLNYFTPAAKDHADQFVGKVDLFHQLVRRLPITDMPPLRTIAPFYFEWLEHPTYSDHWRSWSPAQHFEKVKVPPLITTGWYDAFVGDAGLCFRDMTDHGATEAARHPQLIIGPWAHSWWGSAFPEHDFGEAGDKEVFNLTARTARWFDHHLKGHDNGVADEPPIHLFIMGANEWRDEVDWPLPDTRFTPYYLHSGGRANTGAGDGTLSTQPPGNEREDIFVYDPLDPVPTIGGQTLLPPARMPANAGPRDQRELEPRADILFYTTPVLTRDTEVTGPVELVLHIASSAPDTDFTGKLVDVFPNGRAQILTEGILRVRYR